MTTHRVAVFAVVEWVSRATDLFEHAIASVLARKEYCVVALSGGATPAPVFAELAARDLDWSRIVLTQVDERVAPRDSGQRNITGLREAFSHLPVRWIPLPVDDRNLLTAGTEVVAKLEAVAGSPPVLDVVHLGLGSDGHTASLIPGDPILDVVERDIGVTGLYQGTRRLTMTRAILERADLVLWLVSGSAKSEAVRKLVGGDRSIPAGQLDLANSVIAIDSPAYAGSIA